ncbi:MAG: TetR/AcrR family transcriptional regulator [Thermodesulfobacteriota bacterium]
MSLIIRDVERIQLGLSHPDSSVPWSGGQPMEDLTELQLLDTILFRMNIHSSPKMMKKQDKRSDIIGAALDLIVERGFHGTSMAMVAEKADVGAGTIYHYFESKEALIKELYQELEEKVTVMLWEGNPISMPIRERFIHLWTVLLKYFIAHPLYFRYMQQYHNSPYGVSLRREKMLSKVDDRDIFKKLFEEGISQQTIKDLPLSMLSALAFGPLVSMARDHTLGFTTLDDPLIAETVQACWHGIKR